MAEIVASARAEGAGFNSEQVKDVLFDGGFDENQCDALGDMLRNCFPPERYSVPFDRTALKTALVRAKIPAPSAERLLDDIVPAIVTRTDGVIRARITRTPSPGRVVMCDFRHLNPPEMQKERRAIVVSPRSNIDHKRCTVVPVSMTEDKYGNPFHFKFEAGRYPFFHQSSPVWAVCDHQYTVSISRLWQVNVDRRPQIPPISQEDLANLRALVGTALGIKH